MDKWTAVRLWFRVGWITVLDSVPDIDMLAYLPDIMDGLLNMLSDPNREIRQQAWGRLSRLTLVHASTPFSVLN